MTRKAFILGVNDYPGCPLAGCVNDALACARMLTGFGWRESDIRLLTDSRVTKDAWAERMEWLIDVGPGDCIFYAESGHGSQIGTRDKNDEPDGLDELFCLRDFKWADVNGTGVRDKEFAAYIARIPAGVNAFVMSDSCYSGDLMREMPRAGNPVVQIPRSYPMPADVRWGVRAALKLGFQPKGILSLLESLWQSIFGRPTPVPSGVVTTAPIAYVSGCRSDQTSADTVIAGQPCGAMTRYFWNAVAVAPDAPFRSVVESARYSLRHDGYSQEPQAEGGQIERTCRSLLGGAP